ncbi:hypothetical protein CERZMDRAFT_102702 [Cercospora zeae-maydis SCOH1-5]|uniref:Uncharacterized protein n=1 Tax=Cercospora zeae-maydis SCOH1-5 TaxID=717836 RepID=A0A6A6F4C9_9PEZI|nr:hypothetical protein CERZMDRAFT_102702 [Cercospora zeae-maydis SCOH1-5]
MNGFRALLAMYAMVIAVMCSPARAGPAGTERQAPPRPYGYPPPGYGPPVPYGSSSGMLGSAVSSSTTTTSSSESAGATEVSPIGASNSSSIPGFTPSFSSLSRTAGPLTTSTSTRYFTESIVWPFPIGTSVSSTEGSPVTASSTSSFWYGNSSSTNIAGPTGTGVVSPTSTFTSRSTTTVTLETTIYISPVPIGTAPTGGSTEGSPVGASSSSPYYGTGTLSSSALAGPTASSGFWPTGSPAIPSSYGGFNTTLPWSGFPSSSSSSTSGGVEVSPTEATETTSSPSTSTSFSIPYGTGISSSSSSDDGSTEVSPITPSESASSMPSSGFLTSTSTRTWGAPLPYGPQTTVYGGPGAYGAYGQSEDRGGSAGGWGWWGRRGE